MTPEKEVINASHTLVAAWDVSVCERAAAPYQTLALYLLGLFSLPPQPQGDPIKAEARENGTQANNDLIIT